MRFAMITFAAVFASNALASGVLAEEAAKAAPQAAAATSITADTINAAALDTLLARPAPSETEVALADPASSSIEVAEPAPAAPNPAIVRLQVLLDRAGSSPGVIDGFDGDNVRKAVMGIEEMHGLPIDGVLDEDVLNDLQSADPVIGTYTIVADDAAAIGEPIPKDYAEMAQRDYLGYTSMPEELAERFHMDIDLLQALNPGAGYRTGDTVLVTAFGPNRAGEVKSIIADKARAQLRAYDASGTLLVSYPATIGSQDTPSPSGTHTVEGVAPMPNYTYNPKINFQQGGNTDVLTIPPGPNGPVGSMWIDLSEPTYGIHGTPEPSLIDKTNSHGCVRLTNWDAEELAAMVKPGVTVDFEG